MKKEMGFQIGGRQIKIKEFDDRYSVLLPIDLSEETSDEWSDEIDKEAVKEKVHAYADKTMKYLVSEGFISGDKKTQVHIAVKKDQFLWIYFLTKDQNYVSLIKVMQLSNEVTTKGATNTNTNDVEHPVSQSTKTVSLQDAVNEVLSKELPKSDKPQKKVSVFKKVSSASGLKDIPLSDAKKDELEAFWIENFVSETPKGFEATITPELAHYAVKYCMPRNRLTKVYVLNKYCKAMLAGKWELNGCSIIVNTDGKIEDGGHRLTACYNSQLPLKTMANVGQPVASHKTIDRGASRQIHDDLEFEFFLSSKLDIPAGAKGHTICRKVVSWMKAWRKTITTTNNSSAVLCHPDTARGDALTDEIKRVLCENERIFASFAAFEKMTRNMPSEVTISSRGYNRFEFIRLTGAATPLCQYYYLQPEKATSFIERILNPYKVDNEGKVAHIAKDDPASQVRDYLINNRGVVSNGMGKVEELYFRMVSAIHADYKDRKISVLRRTKCWFPNWSIPIDGSYEKFPSPEETEGTTAAQQELDSTVEA